MHRKDIFDRHLASAFADLSVRIGSRIEPSFAQARTTNQFTSEDVSSPTVFNGLKRSAFDVLKCLDVRMPEHRMGLRERVTLIGIDE